MPISLCPFSDCFTLSFCFSLLAPLSLSLSLGLSAFPVSFSASRFVSLSYLRSFSLCLHLYVSLSPRLSACMSISFYVSTFLSSDCIHISLSLPLSLSLSPFLHLLSPHLSISLSPFLSFPLPIALPLPPHLPLTVSLSLPPLLSLSASLSLFPLSIFISPPPSVLHGKEGGDLTHKLPFCLKRSCIYDCIQPGEALILRRLFINVCFQLYFIFRNVGHFIFHLNKEKLRGSSQHKLTADRKKFLTNR